MMKCLLRGGGGEVLGTANQLAKDFSSLSAFPPHERQMKGSPLILEFLKKFAL